MLLNESIYFNPELSSQSIIVNNNQQIVGLVTNLGCRINIKIQFTIGPSIVWNYAANPEDLNKPFFSIYKNEINENNNLTIGFRVALKYNLTDRLRNIHLFCRILYILINIYSFYIDMEVTGRLWWIRSLT